MGVEPALQLVDGQLAFPGTNTVLVIDPSARLVRDLVEAWTVAVPTVAAPTLEDLMTDDGAAVETSTAGSAVDRPTTAGDVPELRVLARESTLDAAFAEFHTASRAAGLASIDRIALRTLSEPASNALVVDDEKAAALIRAPDGWLAVDESNAEAAVTVRETYTDAWATGGAYQNRTPCRTELYSAYVAQSDTEVAGELLALMDASSEIYREDACNQLVRPYLVGARHGMHHYDLRRAGEEAGLASQATFSRIKVGLVEDGILDTERVPRSVGRPRQRIVLGDDRLADAPLEAYPGIVADVRES